MSNVPPEGWIGPWPIPDDFCDPSAPWPPKHRRRGFLTWLRDSWSDYFGSNRAR